MAALDSLNKIVDEKFLSTYGLDDAVKNRVEGDKLNEAVRRSYAVLSGASRTQPAHARSRNPTAAFVRKLPSNSPSLRYLGQGDVAWQILPRMNCVPIRNGGGS